MGVRFSKCALALANVVVAYGAVTASLSATAHTGAAQVDIVDRRDGRVLPIYFKDGVRWVEGTPGHEYTVRVRNDTNSRVLAVMSVDGVNVITGETAGAAQSGYVVDARASTEVAGWRKNMAGVAAFYFTELADAYAARTGRPENVGVIGVALFRERQRAATIDSPVGRLAPRTDHDAADQGAAGADANAAPEAPSPQPSPAGGRGSREAAADGGSVAKRAEAIAPASRSLGTGHGRHENSRAQYASFERESDTPYQTIVIRYDRRDNLVALGVLPPPVIARRPDPFPATPGFVPDPPRR